MAPTNPTSTTKTKANRLPAPALFIGPPSRNASNLSLARPAAAPQSSNPRQPTTSQPPSPRAAARPLARQSASPPSSPTANQPQPILDLTRQSPSTLRPKLSKSSLEAQWTDLQRTLNEVEAAAPLPVLGRGAAAGTQWAAGATVFGARHAEALRSLREAQIRLAEAWGPVAGEDEEVEGKAGKGGSGGETGQKSRERVGSDKSRDGAEGVERGKQERRQRDGEQDLKTAAERRETNEEYFAKVKAGVQDVVAKLDEVSKAMRRVEGEGREIWEDSSLDSQSRERVAQVEG